MAAPVASRGVRVDSRVVPRVAHGARVVCSVRVRPETVDPPPDAAAGPRWAARVPVIPRVAPGAPCALRGVSRRLRRLARRPRRLARRPPGVSRLAPPASRASRPRRPAPRVPGPAPSGGGAASGLISGRQARPAVARQRIPRCRPVVSPPRRCAARFPPVPPPINPAPIPEQVDERARESRRVPPRPRAASPRLPRRLRRLPWCFPAGARRGGAHGDVAVVIVPVKRSDLKLLLFGFATLQHSTQPKNAKKTNHSV